MIFCLPNTKILGRPCLTKRSKNENANKEWDDYLASIPDAAERNRNLK